MSYVSTYTYVFYTSETPAATAASNPSVSLPAPEHGCHAFPIPEEYLGMIATAVSAANITIFIKAKYMVN